MTKEKTRFALIGRPTMIFTIVRRYSYLDFIPCVLGRYVDDCGIIWETRARVADVVFH